MFGDVYRACVRFDEGSDATDCRMGCGGSAGMRSTEY